MLRDKFLCVLEDAFYSNIEAKKYNTIGYSYGDSIDEVYEFVYSTNPEYTNKMYSIKEYKIKTALSMLNNSPLLRREFQFWKKNWVIYFQQGDKQISFHDYHGRITKIKTFPFDWIGFKNKEFPFI